MPKVKYDVKGVDPGQDFSEPIPTGMYIVRVSECALSVSNAGNDQIAVTYEVVEPDKWKNRLLWDYVVLEVGWKLRQFLEAVGHIQDGKGERGDFEPEEFIGRLVQARVKHQTSEEYGTRAKIGNVIAMPEDAAEVEAESPKSDDEEPLGWDDLAEMELDDLKDVIDDEDLDIRVTKRSRVERIRERVAEALDIEEPEEEPEPDDEPAEPEDEEDEDDYPDWTVAELKSELKERGLATGGKQATLIKRLRKDDAAEDDEPF